ncbi:phosphoenolpyruvate--protein phosphotransferase [Actinomyces minihominis]|uniref:phosphoenolpyruvate--protein phosphotransferase n=1 Tax=Actinomyces minihominis TaxID=2002838 RepID=UPI000C080431|nr:phosphoenolpyruvate--protein phosphotransferase [Actinomyces minihominis]
MPDRQTKEHETVIHGTPVVDGIAFAPAAWTRRPPLPPETAPELPEDKREAAVEDFEAASKKVAEGLRARAVSAEGSSKEVLEMTAGLAEDRGYLRMVKKDIMAGTPPIQATIAATSRFVEMFEKAGALMAERTTDLRDVRDRIIARLQGVSEPGVPHLPYPVVVMGDDLSPADTAGMDPKDYVAIVTEGGGPTSHTSIIARQLGIPCIVAARDLSEVPDGADVLVDGSAGTVTMGVDPDEARALVQEDCARIQRIRAWKGPAKTKDGVPVQLLSNIQDGATARLATESEAEGIGLFRTELLFLSSAKEPSVDEQAADYLAVFEAFPQGKVVVRTLDAGSDKPVPFATLQEEFNPALGVRGIRVTGQDPDLMLHQLDAIAQASAESPGTKVWVMAPMISTLPEAEWFAGLCRERGLKPGIMIEVPAAVILINKFMGLVDFVSIGTNDLTQYTMAADRMSPHLAEYTDPWQPAVLELIALTAAAGQSQGKPAGVCGEAAADPTLACVLVGMGITSLSMATSAISSVGATLAHVTMAQCREAATAVRGARDSKEARAVARAALGLS